MVMQKISTGSILHLCSLFQWVDSKMFAPIRFFVFALLSSSLKDWGFHGLDDAKKEAVYLRYDLL